MSWSTPVTSGHWPDSLQLSKTGGMSNVELWMEPMSRDPPKAISRRGSPLPALAFRCTCGADGNKVRRNHSILNRIFAMLA